MGKFEERTRLNKQIKYLKDSFNFLKELYYSANTSHGGTKSKLDAMLNDKRITSFPVLQQFIKAASHVILDSPAKSKVLINKASLMCANLVKDKEKEREEFIKKMIDEHNE